MKSFLFILSFVIFFSSNAQEIMFSNQPFLDGEEHNNPTKLEFTDAEPIYGLVIVPKEKAEDGYERFFGFYHIDTDYGSFPRSTYLVKGENAYIYIDINPIGSNIVDIEANHWAAEFRVAAVSRKNKIVVPFNDEKLGVKAKIKIKRTKGLEYWEKREAELDEICQKLEDEMYAQNRENEANNNEGPKWKNDPFVVFDIPDLSKENLVKALSSWANGGEVINIVGSKFPSRDWIVVTHDITGNILRRETVRLSGLYKMNDGWCYYTQIKFYQQYMGNGQYGSLKAERVGTYTQVKMNCDNL